MMNPSAKKKGWLACDAMTEHVARIVKELFPANISDVTLRNLYEVISPQIFFLANVREKMDKETEAVHYG